MLVFAPALVALFDVIVAWVVRMASMRGFTWLAVSAAQASLTLSDPAWYNEFKIAVYEFVAAKALDSAGLELDSSDPFSDKSMCDAIQKKTGMVLRTVKDRESIRVDVERWALSLLEEKTGLHIRNIRDQQKTKKDLIKYVTPVIADATGLPLTDISDVEVTKADIKNYLEDSALVHLSHDLAKTKALVMESLDSVGMSLDLLVQKIIRKGGIDPVTGEPNVKIDIEMVVLGVLSRALIAAEKRRREAETVLNKNSRRVEQMRASLKRFRVKHGSRMTYERI